MQLDPLGNIYLTGHTQSTTGIATPGSYQPAYTSGGDDVFLAKFITCYAPTVPAITGAGHVCQDSTLTLADATGGGAWSSVSAGIATVSPTGMVTGTGGGTDTIRYALTNACGTSYTHTVVTVNPLPNPGAITGVTQLCASSASSPLGERVAGGTWSSSSTSVATVNGTGAVFGVAAGLTVISYSVTNACGTVPAAFAFTVNPLPVAATISGTSTICPDSATSLTPAISGGTWSSGATAIATVSGGNVTGVSAGTAIITYTITNSCGSAPATYAVSVVNDCVSGVKAVGAAPAGLSVYPNPAQGAFTILLASPADERVTITLTSVTGRTIGTYTTTTNTALGAHPLRARRTTSSPPPPPAAPATSRR